MFSLEDRKRSYSNKETRGADGADEWFCQHYDKDGFSVWSVDFNHEELTQTYMSTNKIDAFFNRLEVSRKYLFGSVGVLVSPNNSVITGAFIARGLKMIPVVEVALDWESYSYERINGTDGVLQGCAACMGP